MEYLYYLQRIIQMTEKIKNKRNNKKFYGYTGPVKPETLADRASASGELDYLTVKPTNKSFSPLNSGPKITLKGFVKDKKKGGTNKD